MKNETDWPFEAWQKIAVIQLGISPSEFWQLSLMDWFSVTKISVPKAMRKSDLIKLEQEYE